MLTIALALAPIFLLILLGHALKRWRFLPDAFWAPAEKLTYYVTFPALLVGNLAGADLAGLAWGPVALAVAGATVAAGALSIATRPLLGASPAAFTSAFQGSIRPNTYVGLAGAAALYGEAGVTVTAICIAAVVPLVNVLAVAVLTRVVPGREGPGALALLKGIATNPIIQACVLGIALNLLGWPLPPVVKPFLEILARAALPVGLLAVGAGLALDALKTAGRPVIAASLLKLVALPGLAAVGLGLLGVGGPAEAAVVGTVVLYAGLPCSASAYVLARQMGGDAPLMANVITAQTLAAVITLPLVLRLLAP